MLFVIVGGASFIVGTFFGILCCAICSAGQSSEKDDEQERILSGSNNSN